MKKKQPNTKKHSATHFSLDSFLTKEGKQSSTLLTCKRNGKYCSTELTPKQMKDLGIEED